MPVHDDRRLFEMLILEGAQAGLSWITILRKREHYRRAFDNFDAGTIARYDARASGARCSAIAGIVRNRLKIAAIITNARALSRGAGGRGRASTRTSGRSSAARRSATGRATLSDVPAATAESTR